MKKLALFLALCLVVTSIGLVAVFAEDTNVATPTDLEPVQDPAPVEDELTEDGTDETPVDETPVDETSVDETPAEEPPVVLPETETEKGEEDLSNSTPQEFDIVDGVIQRYKGSSIAITLPKTYVAPDGSTKNVTRLEQAVFKGNTKIVSLALEAPIDMDDGSFSGCTSLQSISLQNFLTYVPNECFKGCTSLAAISWSTGMVTVGQGAFQGCTSLRAVAMPAGTDWIDDNAFKDCTNLVDVDIANTVTFIGQGAFQNDTSLASIFIPDSVKTVGNSAFQNCSAAKSLRLSPNLTEIKPYTFSGCSSVTHIRIPNGVTTIGTDAFRNCAAAGYVSIPASVIYVGQNAFNGRNGGGWIRWDDCSANATIAPDGLGTAGYLLAPIDSPAHVYAKSHSGIKFCSTLVRDFVERCYTMLLGRGSDEPGLLNWCQKLIDGAKTGASLVKSFTDSTEFQGMNLSNSEIIERLYNVMLNRGSDPSGKANWLYQMDVVGVTKDRIINGFSGSQEFLGVCKKYGIKAGKITLTSYRDINPQVTAFVARCYTQALDRAFDPKGLESWCKLILTGKRTATQVAHGFIFSPEFKGKKYNNTQFVHKLYRTYFDRNEDAQGMAYWVGKLNEGKSREYVNNGFTGSQEWIKLLKKYGLKK